MSGTRGSRLPDDGEHADIRVWWRVYERHHAEIQGRLRDAAGRIPGFAALVRATPPDAAAREDAESFEHQRRTVQSGDYAPYVASLHERGAQYARAGIEFSAWFELTATFRREALEFMLAELDGDQLVAGLRGLNRWIDLALTAIGEAYLRTKEEIITQQQRAIRELSTPVLQLRDRLLILPVVGVVDTQRARQLTEDLLRAIRDRRARLVVMDITGVPIVDSKVANHFVQTVEAARLMGATVIMTGISAEIAQTLVTIGADLRHVRTLGDLQSGLEEANRILGFKVVRVEDLVSGAT